ncbi:putative RNA polymerase II nuclear localization protein SLC7A6OS [Pelodytes ibericus]
MEAAVLRVKRKRGADPAEALVISCKRLRSDQAAAAGEEAATGAAAAADVGPGAAVTTQVFRLAATVSSQNEPLQKYVREAISRDRANQALHPSLGSTQRIQQEIRALKDVERQNSRYRVVSNLRPTCKEGELIVGSPDQLICPDSDLLTTQSNAETSKGEAETNSNFQLVDMVQEEPDTATELKNEREPETIMCNSVNMIRERLVVSEQSKGREHRESSEEFVYDIYYAEASPHAWIQDILSVQPYTQEQELVPEEFEPEDIYEDEDDENEENNWRNDYPDEDDSDKEERYQGYYEDVDEDDAWSTYYRHNLKDLEKDDDND